MTYRLDSDIPHPYGWPRPRAAKSFVYQPTLTEISSPGHWIDYDRESFLNSLPSRPESFWKLSRRPTKVAWIVSNCKSPSEREKYVDELKRHVQVDIFGRCGKQRCDRNYDGKTIDSCTKRVDKEYKFYLSFENSFCDGYATEKFWWRLSMNVVPVVMGQANYSLIAPPHSLINVGDFETPGSLAEFLKGMSDEEYLSYFWWKDHYEVSLSQRESFCKLCAMLNDEEIPTKTYDMTTWWKKGGHCKDKGSFYWSKPGQNWIARP